MTDLDERALTTVEAHLDFVERSTGRRCPVWRHIVKLAAEGAQHREIAMARNEQRQAGGRR